MPAIALALKPSKISSPCGTWSNRRISRDMLVHIFYVMWLRSLTHTKPFHRNYRGFALCPNSGYSQWAYIIDRDYAIAPEHYVRAFLLMQNDLVRLFEFIEPADENLSTYSYRTHELLIRSCIEAEANFKAILKERSTFTPFAEWKSSDKLTWYHAYNKSKHDRQHQFKLSNLENLLNAITGLLVLLSSQFCTQEFSPASKALAISGYDYYEGIVALGGFFRIELPSDWSDDELYEFDWQSLKNKADRFNRIDYNLII